MPLKRIKVASRFAGGSNQAYLNEPLSFTVAQGVSGIHCTSILTVLSSAVGVEVSQLFYKHD